jgi:hypothetical protein
MSIERDSNPNTCAVPTTLIDINPVSSWLYKLWHYNRLASDEFIMSWQNWVLAQKHNYPMPGINVTFGVVCTMC